MTELTQCPLCRNSVQAKFDPATERYDVHCSRRCGPFSITREFSEEVPALRESHPGALPALSVAVRQASESGNQLTLRTDNWKSYADQHLYTPLSAKVRNLLEVIRARSKFAGYAAPFLAHSDCSLVGAVSPEECQFLLSHLQQTDLLGRVSDSSWRLTVKGWSVVEPSGTEGMAGLCFVAMSFDKDLDAAFHEGIKPAVESDCGFKANRVDGIHHNGDICDRIISEIRRSQFMIADFTGQKGGVYFEAGFAKALGREVIWTCRESDFGDLHFDTNHYSHIKWTTPADLRAQLRERIRATVTGARLS